MIAFTDIKDLIELLNNKHLAYYNVREVLKMIGFCFESTAGVGCG